jgi:preprotein translocase subunit SecB
MTTSFIVLRHHIKSVSLNNPGSLHILKDSEKPDIQVNVQVKAVPLNQNFFEVLLDVDIQGTLKEENPEVLFDLKLSYGSLIKIENENASEDDVPYILMVRVPYLAFPFVRNLVADLTRESGQVPVFLTPMDFDYLYQEQNLHKA